MPWNIQSPITSQVPLKRQQQIFAAVLQNRGLTTPRQINEFLTPAHPQNFSPQDLGINPSVISQTARLISQAQKNRRQVLVYGDYDADGLTATAILWETLHHLGLKVLPYIPNRKTDGYGLNINSLQKLQTRYPHLGLVITVDQGITAHQAVNYLRQQAINIVITDHHQPGKSLPPADAIIHTTQVSGSSVAWLAANWLIKELDSSQPLPPLELAAIGTIADILPLVGINRSFVTHGLNHLCQTQRPGLQALLKLADLRPAQLDTHHISFRIAPRLNATGRIAHAIDSLRLLCTSSQLRASQLAQKLEFTNRQRQQLTETMFNHALSQIGQPDKLIFIQHPSYDEGVIGLVAGKLAEKFHRPAIVVSQKPGISKASARSIKNFDIVKALRTAEHLLDAVGGHPLAAGFSIATPKLQELKTTLRQYADQVLVDEDFTPLLNIDCQLQPADFSPALYQRLQKLAPFGFGNPQPLFATSRLTPLQIRPVGKQKQHLKLLLRDSQGRHVIPAIGFGLGHLAVNLSPRQPVNVAYNFTQNTWNGQTHLELKLKDIHYQ